jgi:hypothetical protein
LAQPLASISAMVTSRNLLTSYCPRAITQGGHVANV